MSELSVVGFAGNFQRPSKTRGLVGHVVDEVANAFGGTPRLLDIEDLGSSLGAARRLEDLDEDGKAVIDTILNADILVVGTPVYKGSYSGLFKHVFDLLGPFDLQSKPIILTATGGSDRHALIIEHQLRPLFGFFAAHTAPTGIYAVERDFVEGRISSAQVEARIAQAISELAAHVAHGAAQRRAAE